MNGVSKFALAVVALSLLQACASQQPEVILSKKSAVELRSMQSRMFETSDKKKVYRATIATFMDLGYSIEKVSPEAGTVTADKLAILRMTASIYPRDDSRMIVRSNAIVKVGVGAKQGHQVDGPEFYQKRFFEPLSKALFLTALQVEDGGSAAGAAVNTGSKGNTPATAK